MTRILGFPEQVRFLGLINLITLRRNFLETGKARRSTPTVLNKAICPAKDHRTINRNILVNVAVTPNFIVLKNVLSS